MRQTLRYAIAACLILPMVVFARGEETDKKIRVAIISRMTDYQHEEFRAIMAEENPSIDAFFRPRSFDETDAVVFIMTSQDEAADVPGTQAFPEVRERLKEVSSPTIRWTFDFTYNDGVPMTFVFYSIVDSGTTRIECFAIDAAVEVSRKGQKIENSKLIECAESQGELNPQSTHG